jgi:hypothetical protein
MTQSSSSSHLLNFQFNTYESSTAAGDTNATKNWLLGVRAWANFANPLRKNRSKSTLTSSSELDDTSASHTGEVARAKAIERIAELKECAKEEEITVNDASLWDLLKFISGYTSTEDLNIFLLDGGTFRVMWKTSATRQVGFEFLGANTLRETTIVQDLNTGRYSASSKLKTLPLRADHGF